MPQDVEVSWIFRTTFFQMGNAFKIWWKTHFRNKTATSWNPMQQQEKDWKMIIESYKIIPWLYYKIRKLKTKTKFIRCKVLKFLVLI